MAKVISTSEREFSQLMPTKKMLLNEDSWGLCSLRKGGASRVLCLRGYDSFSFCVLGSS